MLNHIQRGRALTISKRAMMGAALAMLLSSCRSASRRDPRQIGGKPMDLLLNENGR